MLTNRTTDCINKSPTNFINQILAKITNDGLLKHFILACLSVCFVASLTNIALGLPIIMIATTCSLTTFYLIVFLIWRKGYSETLCKVLLVSSLFVAINFVWITNGGSYGPTIIIFQAFLPVFLFLFKIKYRFLIVFISLINICTLFMFEYFYPELIYKYEDTHSRLLDIFSIFIIFLVIEIPILYVAQQYLINQRIKAERSEKIKTAFLANISHEVRTPMNAIIGFSELLDDDDLDSESTKLYIDIIKENGHNLLQIINNVMDASKLESNSVEVNKKPFKIADTFIRLQQKYETQISDCKNLKLDFNIKNADNNLIVNSDEIIIFQILSKLINNALKYTKHGFVNFGVICETDYIKLYVSDSGQGISEDTKKMIFERFYQGEITHNGKNNGVGLGLAISNELTIKLGGRMELSSTTSQGSTFCVILSK